MYPSLRAATLHSQPPGDPPPTLMSSLMIFVALTQEHLNSRRVHSILLQAIDNVFCPLATSDQLFCRELISLKKLAKGDCSWSTIKLVLDWISRLINAVV